MKLKTTTLKQVNKILFICILTLFFAKSNSFAQVQLNVPYEEPLSSRMERSKKVVQKADFIFEGKLLSHIFVPGENSKDETLVNFITIIQITHVYKGDLKLGTIKLIYGGRLYTSHNYSPKFSPNNPAIFFCNESQKIIPQNDSVTNKVVLDFVEPFDFDMVEFVVDYDTKQRSIFGGMYGLYFKTEEEFNQFLQESVPDVKLPISEKLKAIQDSIRIKNNIEKGKASMDSLLNEFKKRIDKGKGLLKKSSGNINYYISNQQLTSTTTERFYLSQ